MVDSTQHRWLGRTGWFRTVDGYKPATDLLQNPRMHADLLGVFKAMGSDSPEFLEAAASSLLNLNGEDHKRYRSIVAPLFTPRAVDSVRPVARAEASRRIDGVDPGATIEFIESFASPYVARITASFLGLSRNQIDDYIHFVELLSSRRETAENRLRDREDGMIGLTRYARSLLRDRKVARGDVVSAISQMVCDDQLPESVAVSLVAGLLSAGHDPTINQLGLMIEIMSARPELWRNLASGATAPAPVIEEVLRFRGTNRQVSRRVAESFEYDGVDFVENEHVVIRLSEANHDPERFAAADAFAVEANHGSHVAFGFGPHFCLGAALARLQLQEALRALTGRLGCPTVVDSAQRDAAAGLIGPYSLWVRFA